MDFCTSMTSPQAGQSISCPSMSGGCSIGWLQRGHRNWMFGMVGSGVVAVWRKTSRSRIGGGIQIALKNGGIGRIRKPQPADGGGVEFVFIPAETR